MLTCAPTHRNWAITAIPKCGRNQIERDDQNVLTAVSCEQSFFLTFEHICYLLSADVYARKVTFQLARLRRNVAVSPAMAPPTTTTRAGDRDGVFTSSPESGVGPLDNWVETRR